MNNLYVYQFTGQKKFIVIPWDQDTTFVSASWPVDQRIDSNVLARRLLADPAKKQYYLAQVKAAAALAVNPGFLNPKLEAYYGVMRNAVLADTKKPWTNEQFEQARRRHARRHRRPRGRHPGPDSVAAISPRRGRCLACACGRSGPSWRPTGRRARRR